MQLEKLLTHEKAWVRDLSKYLLFKNAELIEFYRAEGKEVFQFRIDNNIIVIYPGYFSNTLVIRIITKTMTVVRSIKEATDLLEQQLYDS